MCIIFYDYRGGGGSVFTWNVFPCSQKRFHYVPLFPTCSLDPHDCFGLFPLQNMSCSLKPLGDPHYISYKCHNSPNVFIYKFYKLRKQLYVKVKILYWLPSSFHDGPHKMHVEFIDSNILFVNNDSQLHGFMYYYSLIYFLILLRILGVQFTLKLKLFSHAKLQYVNNTKTLYIHEIFRQDKPITQYTIIIICLTYLTNH
jgi:hypothetical protein